MKLVVKVQALVHLIETAGGFVNQRVGTVVQSKPPTRFPGPQTQPPALFKHVVSDAVRVVS